VKSLHPCLKIVGGKQHIFDCSQCDYEVYLDKTLIYKASSLSRGIMGFYALFFIFGVQYPRSLRKTCTFLSAHVVGLPEPQVVAVQELYNKLSVC